MTAPFVPQQAPEPPRGPQQPFQGQQPQQPPFAPQGPPQQFQQQYYGPPRPSPFANFSLLNWLVGLLPVGLLITLIVVVTSGYYSFGNIFLYFGFIVAGVGGSALAGSLVVKELEKKK